MVNIRTAFLLLQTIAILGCAGCSQPADNTAALEEIKAKARAAHPNDPIAGDKAANEALVRNLEQLAPNANGKEMAALAFLGYYTKKFHATPTACSERGVELKAFSAAFAEANKVPLEIASKLVDSTNAIQRTIPTALVSARKELDRVAEVKGIKVEEVCALIEANAAQMAESIKFANTFPKLYAQLIAG